MTQTNIEIKGSLARLLATENLVVEHKQVPTASFDVAKRVLTLPMWTKASDIVYNMLVGHEVGHALYTPNDEEVFKNAPCPLVLMFLLRIPFSVVVLSFLGSQQESFSL